MEGNGRGIEKGGKGIEIRQMWEVERYSGNLWTRHGRYNGMWGAEMMGNEIDSKGSLSKVPDWKVILMGCMWNAWGI